MAQQSVLVVSVPGDSSTGYTKLVLRSHKRVFAQRAVWIQKIIHLLYIVSLSYLYTKEITAECTVSLWSCALTAENGHLYVETMKCAVLHSKYGNLCIYAS